MQVRRRRQLGLLAVGLKRPPMDRVERPPQRRLQPAARLEGERSPRSRRPGAQDFRRLAPDRRLAATAGGSAMRVLILHNRYQQPGGEDRVVEAERQLLAQNGHAVSVLEMDNSDITGPREAALAGIRAIYSRSAAQ